MGPQPPFTSSHSSSRSRTSPSFEQFHHDRAYRRADSLRNRVDRSVAAGSRWAGTAGHTGPTVVNRLTFSFRPWPGADVAALLEEAKTAACAAAAPDPLTWEVTLGRPPLATRDVAGFARWLPSLRLDPVDLQFWTEAAQVPAWERRPVWRELRFANSAPPTPARFGRISDPGPVAEQLLVGARLGDVTPRQDAFGEPDVSADARTATDRDPPQNVGPRVDDDIVFDDRVPREALDGVAVIVGRETLRAKRDPLVETHVLADDARLANDDSGTVVDEEPSADLRSRVDVNPGRCVGELGNDARDERYAEDVKLVRNSMVGDGGHPGVREDRFVGAGRRRVSLVRRAGIASE